MFRKSQVTETPCMETPILRASTRAESSRASARPCCGRKPKIENNPRSWKTIAGPRRRGGGKFCLASTGLRDDDSTPAIRGTDRNGSAVLYPFQFLLSGGLVQRKALAQRETFSVGVRPCR